MNKELEVEYLKDQVSRLNEALSHYQKIYIDNSETPVSNKNHIINNDYLCPLLLEYDKVIHELTVEIESTKQSLEKERIKVEAIINENEQLKLQSLPRNVTISVNDEIKQVAQNQIDLMTKEKCYLEELLRLSEVEVERLQAEVTEYRLKPETVLFNEQIESMRQQYLNSIHQMEEEVMTLRNIRKDLSNDLEKSQTQLREVEKDNIMLNEKLRFEKQAGEENLSLIKTGLSRIEIQDREKKELSAQIEELRAVIKAHESTKSEWGTSLENLEAKYKEKEQQLYDATRKINEAYQMAETALGEKKSIEIKEMQYLGECERLRGVISGILEDAGIRTREEVDLVRNNYEKEIERLMNELSFCEQNRQELLVDIDRMKRSKSQLEQEIELLHRSDTERTMQVQSSEEVIHNRVVQAEREREDTRLSLISAENNFTKEKTEWQAQKTALENEINYMQKKLASLQISCDKAQSNADRFSKMLSASEEMAEKNRKKYQDSLKNSRHEFEIFKQSSKIRQQELEARLLSTEEAQRQMTSEMRQFLAKQQQISNKWREEAHNITNQYEEKLTQLSREVDRQKKRNDEMVLLLNESKQHLLESEETIEDQRKAIALMDRRLNIIGDSNSMKLQIDSTDQDDSNWQLMQAKKQQQRLIKESVARKYDFFSPSSSSIQKGYYG